MKYYLSIAECTGPYRGFHCLVHSQTTPSQQNRQPCGASGPVLPPGPGRREVTTHSHFMLIIICGFFIFYKSLNNKLFSHSFETQRNGLVFIYDMAGSNYTNFELDLSKKILNLLKVGIIVFYKYDK